MAGVNGPKQLLDKKTDFLLPLLSVSLVNGVFSFYSGYVLFQSSDDELPKAVNVNDKQILCVRRSVMQSLDNFHILYLLNSCQLVNSSAVVSFRPTVLCIQLCSETACLRMQKTEPVLRYTTGFICVE